MTRIAIKSDFRSSKMGAGGHFVKNSKKKKVAYWSKMARNMIESDFRSSKMTTENHFIKKIKKKEVVYDVFVYDLACLLHMITLVVGAYIA